MKSNSIQYLFYFLFSFIFFAAGYPQINAYYGLDPSWHEALIMTIENNGVFGKDFIFNYGPLGYLNTRVLPKMVSPVWLFIFDILMLFNFLFMLRVAFQKFKNHTWQVGITALFMISPWGFIADTSFTLFYFLLFWLLYALETKKMTALLPVIVLSILIFFIKLNLSMIAYGLIWLSFIYFSIIRIFNWKSLLLLILIQILITIGLAEILNVSILDYLKASVQIIGAYQDAMAIGADNKREWAFILGFALLIFIIMLFYIFSKINIILKSDSLIYLILLVGMTWFLCFKQQFTAFSTLNAFGYFLFMPALALLFTLFFVPENRLALGKLTLFILMISIIPNQFIRYKMGGETIQGYFETYPKVANFTPIPYLMKIINYDYEQNFQNKEVNKKRLLPKNILETINNETVDAFPKEISYVFFNRLNYKNRPIIQSYQANNDWLLKQNSNKYESKTAPNFILFQQPEFRIQNPAWMDSKALLAIFRNYEVLEKFDVDTDSLLLLKRKNQSSIVKTRFIKKIMNVLDSKIEIPKSQNLMYLKATIEYNLLGKILRFLYQPPFIYCTADFEDGSQQVFRVIPAMMKSGVLVNKKITILSEFESFFRQKDTKIQSIKSITFTTEDTWGFEKNIELSFEEVVVNQ